MPRRSDTVAAVAVWCMCSLCVIAARDAAPLGSGATYRLTSAFACSQPGSPQCVFDYCVVRPSTRVCDANGANSGRTVGSWPPSATVSDRWTVQVLPEQSAESVVFTIQGANRGNCTKKLLAIAFEGCEQKADFYLSTVADRRSIWALETVYAGQNIYRIALQSRALCPNRYLGTKKSCDGVLTLTASADATASTLWHLAAAPLAAPPSRPSPRRPPPPPPVLSNNAVEVMFTVNMPWNGFFNIDVWRVDATRALAKYGFKGRWSVYAESVFASPLLVTTVVRTRDAYAAARLFADLRVPAVPQWVTNMYDGASIVDVSIRPS